MSLLIFIVALTTVSCGNDEKDDFSGVGKLIAERNKMRYHIADQSEDPKTKAAQNQTGGVTPGRTEEKKIQDQKLSTMALDEKQIIIVDSSSGTPLGRGVAYVNKQGEIIRIKLAN